MKLISTVSRLGLKASLVIGVLAIAPPATAQSLFAFQGIYAGNEGNFIGYPGNGTANTAADPFIADVSFSGMDSAGNAQTMNVHGVAYSNSTYGSVHVYGRGNVTNPYYNSANPTYYGQDGAWNPDGSPDLLAVHGNAGWADTFTYLGTQLSGYKVNYWFRLTGSVDGDVEAGLNFHASDTANWDIFRTSQGNALWITAWHDVVWGQPFNTYADFYGGMTTYLSQRPEGVDFSATGDYSHTLELIGIQMIDPNGNVYDDWSLQTASGATYARIGAVPEPGSCALLIGAGVCALLVRTRKRCA